MPGFIDHFKDQADSKSFGVILANLGTPDAPDTSSVRRFLRQFLSDPRVVEFPRLPWWLILNGIILVIRPSKSAQAYREIWSPEGSPLMVNARSQVEKLNAFLMQNNITNAEVRCAMRYGEPSMMRVMEEFGSLGIDRIVIIPMYPQHSGSTVGSVFDDLGASMSKLRRVPSVRFVNGYADNDDYIAALAESVNAHWLRHERADKLVMSFHGLPQAFCDQGDPYYRQCMVTADLLATRLGLAQDEWTVCFQSRVGRQPWLQPYADDVLSSLPGEGVKSIEMMCPGFSVDCLETLEEVNMGYRELFLESGGESFHYIPCLNDQPRHIEMMAGMITEMANDWIDG